MDLVYHIENAHVRLREFSTRSSDSTQGPVPHDPTIEPILHVHGPALRHRAFQSVRLLTATADLHYAGDRRDARAIEYEHHVLAGRANIRVRGRDHGQGFLPFFKPNAIDALTEIKMVSHRA